MSARINYEDNLLFIDALIKGLSTGLNLQPDAEMFRDKMIEDIIFLDRTLNRLCESLRENIYLIRRAEFLRSVGKAERRFVGLLEEALSDSAPFADNLTPFRQKLEDLLTRHRRVVAEVQGLLEAETNDDAEAEDLVSQDEYRLLLAEEDNEEKP